jgi:hypothetical protein
MSDTIMFTQQDSAQIEDRRKNKRVDADFDYRLLVDGQEFAGKLANISLNGAFLSVTSPNLSQLLMNQKGEISLQVDKETLTLACEIVYITDSDNTAFPVGAGVLFIDAELATQTALLKLNAYLGLVSAFI